MHHSFEHIEGDDTDDDDDDDDDDRCDSIELNDCYVSRTSAAFVWLVCFVRASWPMWLATDSDVLIVVEMRSLIR